MVEWQALLLPILAAVSFRVGVLASFRVPCLLSWPPASRPKASDPTRRPARRERGRALERHLVITFARHLDALGGRWCARSLRPPHELHALRDHLDDITLLAVLRLPVPGLKAPFNHDGAPLVQVLTAILRLLAPH